MNRPSETQLFAEWVSRMVTAPEGIDSFGDDKFFISSVYEEGGFDDEMTLNEFKKKLLVAHREGLVVLSRADLTSAMDPALVRASEINDPLGAEYHFINRAQTRAAVRKAIGLKENMNMARKSTRMNAPKASLKIRKSIDELRSALLNYDHREKDAFPVLIFRVLASLPGGDELEDMGYEPFNQMGWHEAELLGNMLEAIQDKRDVEDLVRGLIAEEEQDEDRPRQRTRR